MKLTQFKTAESFLSQTQNYLESAEVINSLMLGLAIANKNVLDHTLYFNITEKGQVVFAAMMMEGRDLIVYGNEENLESSIEIFVNHIKDNTIEIPGINGPTYLVTHLAKAMGLAFDIKSIVKYRQLTYQLKEIKHEPLGEGRLKVADHNDKELLSKWMDAFFQESLQISDPEGAIKAAKKKIENKEVFLWMNEEAVSMSCIARPTRNGISINYVYTPPAHRKKGYATKLVAQQSKLMLEKGYKFCTLFTDQDNMSTNRMYQKIGYRAVGEFRTVSFNRKNSIK